MGVQIRCEKTEPYLNRHGQQPSSKTDICFSVWGEAGRPKWSICQKQAPQKSSISVQNPAPCSLFQKSSSKNE